MNWKQFIADVIRSIVWPIVVLIIVLLLRGQLDRVIGNAEKVSYGSFEISFSTKVDQIKKEFVVAMPTTGGIPLKAKSFHIIATLSPSTAIIESWKEVQLAASLLILRKNPTLIFNTDTPYKHLELLLAEYEVANVQQIKIFHDLRVLRNKVAHVSGYKVSIEQAVEFSNLALSLAEFLTKQN